jgi:predicted phosphate transport protein (TIGR00153 family)
MRLSFIPQENKFFELFIASGHNLVKIADALKDLLDNWVDIDAKVSAITDLEHAGDSITHEVIALLHKSFVTPFDREDIALLAHTLDDVADFIHAAVDSMYIYKVNKPTERAKELAEIIREAAVEIDKALPFLRKRKELSKMLECCVDINRLENEADRVTRQALGELFEDQRDTAYIIKWREIYEHMETATDRAEDVANVLEGVALKNA